MPAETVTFMAMTDALVGSNGPVVRQAVRWILPRLGVYVLAAVSSMAVFIAWALFYTYVWPGRPQHPLPEPPSINRLLDPVPGDKSAPELAPPQTLPKPPVIRELIARRSSETDQAIKDLSERNRALEKRMRQLTAELYNRTNGDREIAKQRQLAEETVAVRRDVNKMTDSLRVFQYQEISVVDRNGVPIGTVRELLFEPDGKVYLVLDLTSGAKGRLKILASLIQWPPDDNTIELSRNKIPEFKKSRLIPYSIAEIQDAISKTTGQGAQELVLPGRAAGLFYSPPRRPD